MVTVKSNGLDRMTDASVSINPVSEDKVLVHIFGQNLPIYEKYLANLKTKHKGLFNVFIEGELDASIISNKVITNPKSIIMEISFDRMHLLRANAPGSTLVRRLDHPVLGDMAIIEIQTDKLHLIRYPVTSISLSEIVIYVSCVVILLCSITFAVMSLWKVAIFAASYELLLLVALLFVKMWQYG